MNTNPQAETDESEDEIDAENFDGAEFQTLGEYETDAERNA